MRNNDEFTACSDIGHFPNFKYLNNVVTPDQEKNYTKRTTVEALHIYLLKVHTTFEDILKKF